MNNEKNKYWIGFDFDGTLAYHNHEDESLEGKPTVLLPWVKFYQIRGYPVKILTARPQKEWDIIYKFLNENGLKDIEITNSKDPYMRLFYDDRAVSVARNTGLSVETLLVKIMALSQEDNGKNSQEIIDMASSFLICLANQLKTN